MPKKSVFDPYTDWILEHYKDYRNCPELVKALNDNFGLNTNVPAIKFWFSKRFGMTTVYGRYDFSEEEKEFVKKYYPDHGPEKTTEMLNEIFNTNRVVNSVKHLANSKLGLKLNNNLRQELIKSRVKNMRTARSRDVGSVRKYTKKNGHTEYRIKVSDGQWKIAGLVIWEKEYGPVPKGYRVIYLNGDSSDFNLDNLYLASDKLAYQVVSNKHYQTKNPEITKSLIKYYELRNALGVDWVQWHNIEQKFERKLNKLVKEV